MGVSLTGRKSFTIPGDLVTEVTVNREVKIRDGPKRGGYRTSVEAVDDFILKTRALEKPLGALKSRMDVKTSCNHKEFSHGPKKMHEQYIQQFLTTIQTNPFHGPAQNVMSSVEISSNIINDLIVAVAAKANGGKIHLEFVKNRDTP